MKALKRGAPASWGGIFTFNPATLPAKLLIQHQPAAIAANGAVSLKVAVLGAKGKVITNGSFSVTLTLQNGPASTAADFTPITLTTINGIATFTDISLPTVAGTYQFQITEGLLNPVTSRGTVIKPARKNPPSIWEEQGAGDHELRGSS